MAPHGIYPCRGEDEWLAIACRDDTDWMALVRVVGDGFAGDPRYATLAGRIAHQDELDRQLGAWSAVFDRRSLARELQKAGVPSAAVQRPAERIDGDANTEAWGLWPTAHHPEMGDVRVDGLPVHFSKTDWSIERGAHRLGEHNDRVLGGLLGMADDEIAQLRAEGVI